MNAVPVKPDAAFLSAVLRDPSRWPAGFVWDYSDCAHCAIGMASLIWDISNPKKKQPFVDALGLDGTQFNRVFDFLHDAMGLPSRKDVTPDNVADALDAALAARSVQS